MQPTSKTRDVFTLVTDRIIEHLEKGTVPWKQPWTDAGLPRNLITEKPYRGINVWLLNAHHYPQNFFLTYNQAKALGGFVRNGEKAHPVVFWKWVERNSEGPVITGNSKKQVPFFCYHSVFNIAQCSNIPDECIPLEELKKKNDPIKICEEIVELMPNPPGIRHMGDEAYYHPFFDFVNMPSMHKFINSESYYSTLFHELIHSTGYIGRLNRKELRVAKPNDFGQAYSQEELTAEIGACYLNSFAGIDGWDFSNHIAYIDGWLKRLRDDKKCIVYASAQAQRAADYILDVNHSTDELEVVEETALKAEAV